MKKLLYLILIITLSSCFLIKEKGIHFKIENTSNATITNVKISTSENLDSIMFDSVVSNDTRKDFLSMKNNKTDGSYTITYSRKDGSIVAENHGYYTNGGSLESWIRFEITNDSTFVKYGEFPNY